MGSTSMCLLEVGDEARGIIILGGPDHPLARYCPLWHTRPHGFASNSRDDDQSPPHSPVKTRHARERYPHPYKACFVLLPNRCGRSLVGRLMADISFSMNTIESALCAIWGRPDGFM
ncbi:hypothetical protein PIB30_046416 [Stylosanthes scabra]|uniref:Uncharacterized protein n=1 Tax=Stylosanthes scabra TaxID=79078 RepID=A0ABU6UF37_9FABA|nr:hypothetical protein [Stylosanthes scabra]